MENEKKILAWFLGPKAENSTFMEKALLLVLRDYSHWRKSYFPGDSTVISEQVQREIEPQFDSIHQNLLELLAELRKNLPFFSPRYIAHMSSDATLTSIIGYIAGLMYNPNNVTPESAPTTVNLEIRACNALLGMIGFNPPPEVPEELNEAAVRSYREKLKTQFGWGHLTSGGTIANLEALWVARAVKYSPLAIWDTARRYNLDIEVRLPGGRSKDIKELTERDLLLIRPDEAVCLLVRYVDSYRLKHNIPIQDATKEAYDLLKASPYHLSNGVGQLFSEFPPVIFVSGTGHYSIEKAADILGIGKRNIEFVLMDSSLRMDISDLEKRIRHALSKKNIPLAVVPTVGTTGEGAVDPVHRVLSLRKKLEKQDVSFWVHVDAAWGGYLRALLNLSPEDELLAIATKISRRLGMKFTTMQDWHKAFFGYAERQSKQHAPGLSGDIPGTNLPEGNAFTEQKDEIESWEARLNDLLRERHFRKYVRILREFVREHGYLGLNADNLIMGFQDRVDLVKDYVSEVVLFQHGKYRREIAISWGSKELCAALIKISEADSVTVDPHKMGYVNYPCGMIAFRDDRVRHFVLQETPYIAPTRQDILIHMPPEHIERTEQNFRIQTDAFAPFIVEGSRPGAAASAFWLTIQTIPPTMREAGLMIRSSILAARELYEWLVRWEKIMSDNHVNTGYLFVPFTFHAPDTNIVIFGVKRKADNSLSDMNRVSGLVYKHFTIQVESGKGEHRHTQPFFLSKTRFEEPKYPFETLKPLFTRYFREYVGRAHEEYKRDGLVVLRATIMNPYLRSAREMSHQYMLEEFVQELASAARLALSPDGDTVFRQHKERANR